MLTAELPLAKMTAQIRRVKLLASAFRTTPCLIACAIKQKVAVGMTAPRSTVSISAVGRGHASQMESVRVKRTSMA